MVFQSRRIDLVSPLTLAECVSRVSAALSAPRSSGPHAERFHSTQVVGRVTPSSLRLRVRIGYKNSFQSVLIAKLSQESRGTAISGDIRMYWFVRVFLLLWFSGVILIGGTIFVVTARDLLVGAAATGPRWSGLLLPWIMLSGGLGVVWFGRHLARTEGDLLTAFLRKTLDAVPRGRDDRAP